METHYHLDSITETEFRFNPEFDYGSLNCDNIRIQLGYDLSPVKGDDKAAFTVKATLTCADTFLASNAIRLVFGIIPLNRVLSVKKDGSLIAHEPAVIDNLLMVSIGTLRGVLMKNLNVTPLAQFPLPLVSPDLFSRLPDDGMTY